MKLNRRAGLTLIEILTVIAILGIISSLVYKSVIDSIKVWRQEESEFTTWHNGTRVMTAISKDLRTLKAGHSLEGINLSSDTGTPEDRLEFTIISKTGESDWEERLVSYMLAEKDNSARELYREDKVTGADSAIRRSFGKDITGFNIRYWSKITGWVDSWDKGTEIPEAVEVSVSLKGNDNLSTVVHIPTGRKL